MFRIDQVGSGVFLSVLLLTAWGCAGPVNTVIDYDPDADFSGFRTWSWQAAAAETSPAEGATEPVRSLMDQRLEGVVEQILSARGLEVRPPDQADLLVSGRVVSRREHRVEMVPSGGVYRRGSWGYWGAGYESVVMEEEVLWLVLDFQIRATRRQVWTGAKKLPALAPLSPQARRRVSEEAVGELLKSYPPSSAGRSF